MPSSDIDLRAEERAVIIEAANWVAETARQNASWSKTIPSAISISEVREWQAGLGIYVRVDLSKAQAPSARAFEFGSGIHSTHTTTSPRQEGSGGYIDITPKNASMLKFAGTHDWEGMEIRVPPMGHGVVHHPGVAPRPYLYPAVALNRDIIRETLGAAVQRSISSVIRKSWYHSE
jgi:hypothetical protein